MKIRGWYKKHPVAVVVGVFLLADACLVACDGESLKGSLLGAALAALVTLTALAMFVPQTLQRRGSASHRAQTSHRVQTPQQAHAPHTLDDPDSTENVSRETFQGSEEDDHVHCALAGKSSVQTSRAINRANGNLDRTDKNPGEGSFCRAFSCGLVVTLVVLAGLVGGFLGAVCIENVSRETLSSIFANFFASLFSSNISCDVACVALALCIATALFEEGFFRGLLMPCIAVQTTALRAAIVSAIVFGVLHILSAVSAPAPTLTPEGVLSLDFAVLTASAILKTIQTTLFGFCMAALFLHTGNIWMPVFAHAVFDCFYFAPHIIILGKLPMTYLSANSFDLAVLAVTIVLLLLPSGKCLRWLRSNVVTYPSLDE